MKTYESATYLVKSIRETRSIVPEGWQTQIRLMLERLPVQTPLDIAMINLANSIVRWSEAGREIPMPNAWRDERGLIHIQWVSDSRTLEIVTHRDGLGFSARLDGQFTRVLGNPAEWVRTLLDGMFVGANATTRAEMMSLTEVHRS